MIVVHHLDRSRSQRILWLLEELGLPYEVRRYEREGGLAAPAALRKVHPLGKSPVIEDGGRVIAESGAIVEYLVEKAGGKLGAPADEDGRLRYRYFLHYAEASLMASLLTTLVLGRVSADAAAGFGRQVEAHLDFVEAELGGRPWFAGEAMTAADAMMSFPLELAVARLSATSKRPHIAAWLKTVHALPGYQAALTKGGPYDYADAG